MIIKKEFHYLNKIYNFPSTNLLFEDLRFLMEEKYIDFILTLTTIYYFSDVLNRNEFGGVNRIFIPAVVLFNKNIIKEAVDNLPENSPIFKNLNGKLKMLVDVPEALDELDVSMRNMYQCLFDAGFFDKLCFNLFEEDKSNFCINIDHGRLVRLWLHLSSDVENRDKIITNYLKLGNIGYQDELKVFYSLVRNDSTYEKLLLKFFKDIGMPPKYTLNLLRILDYENTSICFKAAYNLLDDHCINPQVIASFLS